MNFKCTGPEAEAGLANGKAARRPVAKCNWGGEQKGCGRQRSRGLGHAGSPGPSWVRILNLILTAAVLPLWILALGQSSPGGGGRMGKKSGNISPAARGPSLKVGKAGRGWWPQLPCEASDLCPPPLLEPVGELEAAAGDPTHNAGRVETPRGIRISIWEQKPISNCGLSPFPFVCLPWEHPARKPQAPL